MKIMNKKLLAQAGTVALLISLAAGCATGPKTTKTSYFFWPPPPDEPRLQFLTAFGSEKEFRGGEEKSLMTFITGVRPADKDFGKPYGAAVSGGKLYVCDTDLSAVLVADFKTKHFGVLESQGEGAIKLPLNIMFDAEGNSYIVDVGREQVVILDKDTNFVGALGKVGEMKPRDVVVGRDRIYVADLQRHCVKVFDKSRKPLFDIPNASDAKIKSHGLFTPTNLGLDSKDRLYVSDTGAFRVQVYDADGSYLRSIGEMGDSLGQFARVKGIALDREDRLYVVDAMSQVMQIFNSEGKLLTWFGEPDSVSGLQNLPAKVLVDYEDVGYYQSFAAPNFKVEYLVFVINQLGPHKVSVYGFGHRE